MRFGDGDVNLALGHDDSYQKANHSLQSEMREAFGLEGPNVLKCLPIQCKELDAWEQGMFPGNHESSYEFSISPLLSILFGLEAPFLKGAKKLLIAGRSSILIGL